MRLDYDEYAYETSVKLFRQERDESWTEIDRWDEPDYSEEQQPPLIVNRDFQSGYRYAYDFYDSWGDGICCEYGSGSYTITQDSSSGRSGGNVIASGGDFEAEIRVEFEVQ